MESSSGWYVREDTQYDCTGIIALVECVVTCIDVWTFAQVSTTVTCNVSFGDLRARRCLQDDHTENYSQFDFAKGYQFLKVLSYWLESDCQPVSPPGWHPASPSRSCSIASSRRY